MIGDCVAFDRKARAGRGPVLVVEDDYLVREILSATLAEFGLQVSCASDGESALALLSVAPLPFRLAIVDLRLPGLMNGEELARQIRASGMAAILMSADHERLDAVRRSDASAVCLEKPFSWDTLRDCIERTMTDVGCGT
jgi:DNA-binding response OmpR family regulator